LESVASTICKKHGLEKSRNLELYSFAPMSTF
jgi:hypothetical protein